MVLLCVQTDDTVQNVLWKSNAAETGMCHKTMWNESFKECFHSIYSKLHFL